MEKKHAVAIVASKAAGEEAPVEASVAAAIPIQAPVPASEAAAVPVQAPVPVPAWDPYEAEEEYVPPENPFHPNIVDNEPEQQDTDVDSDDEAFHAKARHILRRLQSVQYDHYFAGGVYRCPFCNRKLSGTDFNCVVTHAEAIGSFLPNVGKTVNVHLFMAHHKALEIHLHNLQKVAIAEGRMPPIRHHRRGSHAEASKGLVELSVCSCCICKKA